MHGIHDKRRDDRHLILLPGRMRTMRAVTVHVAVTDLSPTGCQILGNADLFGIGQAVFIRLGQIEPLKATVRWRNFQIGGLEFDRPLYLPVAEHLAREWRPTVERNMQGAATTTALQKQAWPSHRTGDCKDGRREDQELAVLVQHPDLGYRMRYS